MAIILAEKGLPGRSVTAVLENSAKEKSEFDCVEKAKEFLEGTFGICFFFFFLFVEATS